MRRYTTFALFVILALVAVACVALGPEIVTTRVPLVTDTPTAEEIVRGVGRDVHIMDATNTPTPGGPADVWLFPASVVLAADNCATPIAAAEATAAWSGSISEGPGTAGFAGMEAEKDLIMCNDTGGAITCYVSMHAEGRGMEASPDWASANTSLTWRGNRRTSGSTFITPGPPAPATVIAAGECVLSGFPNDKVTVNRDAVGTFNLDPLIIDGLYGDNEARLWVYGWGGNCEDVAYASASYEYSCTDTLETVTPSPTPTVTPTPTTTPTATPTSTATVTPTPTTQNCSITEVHASMDEGTPVPYTDWNGRNGIGVNDEFVEIMCPTERSTAKFTLDNNVCFFVYPDDTIVGPLKVIFSDEMLTAAGAACPGFDAGDTWTLNNAQSTPISTREVPTMVAAGNAWGAVYWRIPAGTWAEGTPSPGGGPP